MICNQCGAQIPDGSNVCPNCGAAVSAQPQYQQPYQAQPVQAQPNTLTFGILSLVFCETVILGLIFAIIGRKKGKAFIAQGGTLTGASKVGFILSKVGLILSILFIVYWVIWIALLAAGVATGAFLSY